MTNFNSNPFVGLRPFESDESILFFGRQQQVAELLQRLHQFHFVALTGTSGSGKSSLIKAGLIPLLKAGYLVKSRDRWIIASMKPGESPLCNLGETILNQTSSVENNLTVSEFEKKIKEEGVAAILEILEPVLKGTNTNFFLLVDQFEELFRFAMSDEKSGKKDDAIDFVNILLELLSNKELPIYVVITMRSDFIGDCADFYGLPEAINQSQYLVPKLTRLQLRTTIEAPIKLSHGKIAPVLTAKLLNDTQLVKDELPLLQHALMRIWDYKKTLNDESELNTKDYEQIGGIKKALSYHADEALAGLSGEEYDLIKKIFQALTTLDENGRKIRRPVRLSELQSFASFSKEHILSILSRFIADKRNFLIISKIENKDDSIIDISHESLIRQWKTLNKWVDEEAESSQLFIRLCQSYEQYKKKEKDLLTGSELQLLSQWYSSFKPTQSWSKRYNINYTGSIEYLKESEREEKKQRLKKIRQQRTAVITSLIVILSISVFAIILYKNYRENKRQLSLNYWQSSEDEKLHNRMLEGLHFLAEATKQTDDKLLLENLLIDAEAFLPKAVLVNVFQHNDIVNSAFFNKRGNLLVTACNDGVARIFDEHSGNLIASFKNDFPIKSAAFNPDATKLLTVGYATTAQVWDVRTSRIVGVPIVHNDIISSAVISPDGQSVVTASLDGTVRLSQLNTGLTLETLIEDAADQFTCASFSLDGSLVAVGSIAGKIRILNIKSKKIISPVIETGISITSVALSEDIKSILTAGSDSTATIWDATSAEKIKLLKHSDKITSAVFSPGGKTILTASRDKTAKLWNIATGKQMGTDLRHQGPVYSAEFSSDGMYILTAGFDRSVREWSTVKDKNERSEAMRSTRKLNMANFSPDDKSLVILTAEGNVEVFDRSTRKLNGFLNNSTGISSIAFSNDGSKILTGSNKDLSVWSYPEGNLINSFKNKFSDSSFTGASFSNDAKDILSFYKNGKTVFIYETSTGKLINEITQKDEVTAASLSVDKKNILITTVDSTTRLINIVSKKVSASFKHEDLISSAVFSPDGKSVLTASWDNTARLWNAITGKQVGPPLQHDAAVNSAVFSPDGNWLLTSAWDAQVRLWSQITFKEIGVSYPQPAKINTAFFNHSNNQIIASTDSIATVIPLKGDLDLPADLFQLQTLATTGVMLDVTTGETRSIENDVWRSFKKQYEQEASSHFENCKFPQFNFWKLANFKANIAKH